MAKRRSFGWVRQRASGRFQASYVGPDGLRYNAPGTFDTRLDADAWLAGPRADIARGVWAPPVAIVPAYEDGPLIFGEFAATFLATQRTRTGAPLTDRTRSEYARLLDRLVLPRFADRPLSAVTRAEIETWYAELGTESAAQTANAYTLVKAIFNAAIKRQAVPGWLGPNPCQIEGGGSKVRESVTTVASPDELDRLYALLPPQYRVMALLCSWLGLRMGEVIELRRKDVNFARGLVHVHRGATHSTSGGCRIQATKGKRKADMPLLGHLVEPLRWHLDTFAEPGRDGRLFPPARGGCHMLSSSINSVFDRARRKIDRPDLRFHDLRHTALVRLAEEGATGAELMEFGRHATLSASARYQSVARGRMAVLAQRLDERHERDHGPSNVVDIATQRAKRQPA